MKIFSRLNIVKLYLLLLIFSPVFVVAVGDFPPDDSGGTSVGIYKNPLEGTSSFSQLLTKVLGVLIDIGIPLLVLFIVFAGFKFITAQGNATKVEDAKKALLWAVIGGAVLIGAEVIQRVVESTVKAIGG